MHLICRFCRTPLRQSFCDLGMSPMSNANLRPDQLNQMEPFYPLHAYVCDACLLVQLESFETPDHIFNDHYAYFSSYSESWLAHAKAYAEKMTARFGLTSNSQVIEIASNDGYLLQYFVQKKIPVLGVEPSGNVASAAREKGVETLEAFFGESTANTLRNEGKSADLLLGNNVLAHIPDLNDFVAGLKVLLKPQGVITMEFPHLLQLMQKNQFDTIYHEHFSYFSFATAEKVFAAHDLTLFDVEELSTHGGSLRIYARHTEDETQPIADTVNALRAREAQAGLDQPEGYQGFEDQVRETKRQLLEFFDSRQTRGQTNSRLRRSSKRQHLIELLRHPHRFH